MFDNERVVKMTGLVELEKLIVPPRLHRKEKYHALKSTDRNLFAGKRPARKPIKHWNDYDKQDLITLSFKPTHCFD